MKKWVWAWGVFALVAAVLVTYQMVAGHKGIGAVATKQKVVALTFDDGPDERTTGQLLKILKEHGAKATFFVMGRRAEELPAELAQIAADGHEIGNHGFSHKWLTKLADKELAEEISRTEAAIMGVAPKPSLFRPPGAYYNEKVLSELKSRGYTMVMWSIDTRDWARQDHEAIAGEVAGGIKPGSIILMHDGSYAANTPKAVAAILDRLGKQGYQFVTVSELLRCGEEQREGILQKAAGF